MPGPPKPTSFGWMEMVKQPWTPNIKIWFNSFNIHVDSQPLISIDGHHVPCNGIFTYYIKGWNLWAVKEMLGGWSINAPGHPKTWKKLTYSPKWWFDGDLPGYKVKNHRKIPSKKIENPASRSSESRTKRVSSWFFATKSGQSCKSFPNAKPRSCWKCNDFLMKVPLIIWSMGLVHIPIHKWLILW